MSIIKKILLILPIIFIATYSQLSAEEVKKIGKYKDWESMVVTEATGKVCFAQSSPILQAPKSNKRDAKLFKEQGFAWIADTKVEFRMISRMKKGSRIMITGYNKQGSQTIDHYSLLGFTKAYNATKKACS